MSLTTVGASQEPFISRPFSLAAAIVVQLGFLYAFTHGMSIKDLVKPLESSEVVFVPTQEPPPPVEQPPEVKQLPSVAEIEPPAPSMPVMEEPVAPVETTVETGQGITAAVAEPPVATAFGIAHRVDPTYPAAARRAGVEGTVLLNVIIGIDGKVSSITIANSSGSSVLDEAAIDAVKRWRFTKPQGGSVQVRLPISFKLENAR